MHSFQGEIGRIGPPGAEGLPGRDGEAGQPGVKGQKGEDNTKNGFVGLPGDRVSIEILFSTKNLSGHLYQTIRHMALLVIILKYMYVYVSLNNGFNSPEHGTGSDRLYAQTIFLRASRSAGVHIL